MAGKLMRAAAVLAILAGAALLLYPEYTEFTAARQTQAVLQQFEEETARHTADTAVLPAATEPETAPEADLPPQTGEDRLYQDLAAYNRQIYEEHQAGLTDPFDYQNPAFDLTEYGYSENVIGVLWIPRLDLELPIYLGANWDNMAKGAGLLGQTSMPLGGENTNTVLAAHRGWKGIPMFRNIQQIQLGDKIQITTPWDTLVYRVCELKIVTPEDMDSILIQPGRDMVTLVTCHPYTHNYQRYLVFAQRSEEERTDRASDLAEAEENYDPAPRQVETVEPDGTAYLTEVAPEPVAPSWNEGTSEGTGAEISNRQIWLENHIISITLALLGVILAIGALIRWIRRWKEERA
ncbi:MAG: class C sortase [Oscillospiraceae bacterium]|nr:class C sortase [Oscillospiraceae bacterium]